MAQRLSDFLAENQADPQEQQSVMRLGDFMAMNKVEYSDEEEKSLFEQGVIPVPSEEDREYFRSKGKIGAFEAFARNAKPSTFVPFLHTASDIARDSEILLATGRLQANDYKDNLTQRNKDAQLLSSYIRNKTEEQERGYSFGGNVINVVKEMPATMVEFMTTGGIATGGRMMARKGLDGLLKRAQANAVTRIVTKKVAGTVGSIATRTAALGALQVPAKMKERELSEQIKLTEKGVQILEQGKTKPFTSLVKSVGDVAFEVASEQSGGTIRKIAGKFISPVMSKMANNRMVKSLTLLMSKLKAGGLVKEMADKAKFDGILEEYGEERWGNFLRAVSGVEDFGAGDNSNVMDRIIASIPSMEESLIELAAFSVPAAGGAISALTERHIEDNAKPVDEPLIQEVADEILIDQGLKEDINAEETGRETLPPSQEEGVVAREDEGIRLRNNEEAGVIAEEVSDAEAFLKANPNATAEEWVESKIQPVKEGFVRLYRGESKAHPPAKDTSDKGRWFTNDLEDAKSYGKRVSFVDITKEEFEQLVKNEEELLRLEGKYSARTPNSVMLEAEKANTANVLNDKSQLLSEFEAAKGKMNEATTEIIPTFESQPLVIKRGSWEHKIMPVNDSIKKIIEHAQDFMSMPGPVLASENEEGGSSNRKWLGSSRPLHIQNYMASLKGSYTYSHLWELMDKAVAGETLNKKQYQAVKGMIETQSQFELENKSAYEEAKNGGIPEEIIRESQRSSTEIGETEGYQYLLDSEEIEGKINFDETPDLGIDEPTAEEVLEQARIEAEQPPTPPPAKPTAISPGEDEPNTGERRVAKATRDLAKAAAAKGMQELPESELATYSSIEKKDQEEKVANLLEDYERSVRMVLGEEKIPSDIAPQVLANAVKQVAVMNGDSDTIMRIATAKKGILAKRSQIASELSSAGFNNMTEADPIKAAAEIQKSNEGKSKVTQEQVSDLERRLAEKEEELRRALEKTETAKAVKSVRTKEFGANNKFVTREMADAARASLRKKLSGLHSGVDPTALLEMTQLGTFYIEGGVRDFAAWSKTMIEDLGEKVKPYLQDVFDRAKSDITRKRRLTTEKEKIEKRLAEGDFSKRQPKPPSTDPGVLKLQREVEQLRSAFKAARDMQQGITEEQMRNLTELSREVQISREKVNPSSPIGSDDRMAYGRAIDLFRNYVGEQKAKNASIPMKEYVKPENWWKGVKNIAGFAKSVVGSFDNSVIGRQGLPVLLTHPETWFKNSVQSFIDLSNVLKGKDVIDYVMADVLSRPNAMNGLYAKEKLDIGVIEESIPTDIQEKIPVLGKLFKASNVAFKAWQYRTRADLFDKLYEMAKNNKADVKGLGIMVNALTGRGKLPGELEKVSKTLNLMFFSPRLTKAQFDILTAHAFDRANMSDFVKKQAAFNTLRTIAILATVLMIAKAFDDDSVETDPRSSDFGKIKIGNTRFNISGGMNALITLAARIATGKTKSATTNILTELNTGEYGSMSSADVLLRFFDNKLSPAGSIISDIMTGEDFEGKKPTLVVEMANLLVPIPIKNAYELMTNEEDAPVLLSILADFVGIGTSTFAPNIDWANSTGKELLQFRNKIGDEKFKEVNKQFNDDFNNWFKDIIYSDKYKNMDEDAKRDLLKDKRLQIKKKIFRKYGFKYRKDKL